MIEKIIESLQRFGLKMVLAYADSNPGKSLAQILHWIEFFDQDGVVKGQLQAVRSALADPNNHWWKLLNSFWTDIDDGVRRRIFENLIINQAFLGVQRQRRIKKKNNCNVPWTILMDPTSACNLNCTGCWAAEYGPRMNLTIDTLNNIIIQGKELGIYMYIYSGGEPLVRKDDLITLCKRHPDSLFLAFTNATLIDETFAYEMLQVKNFIPAISIEGFAAETDSRRGQGTYGAVIQAMKILKEKKLPFGISCCYTSKNTEIIGSEPFLDEMIAVGAKFAWFFTYIPIGRNADPRLMVTAKQRKFMYHQIRKFRDSKPIFTMDFWNDGEYVKGCIAGGRLYLHINANGDIEPCAFIHYSDSNIHQKTILEACKSPLFMQYHHNQPFNENQLRPCPLLDNPNCLAAMVEKSGAKSTEMQHPEEVHHLCAKCQSAAKNWATVADQLWSCSHPSAGSSGDGVEK